MLSDYAISPDIKLLNDGDAYIIWDSSVDNTTLLFRSKGEEIRNVTLTNNYYQINCTTILEWLEKADIMKSEDNDITVTVRTITFVSAYIYDILYKTTDKTSD